jgi:hypothetical protein
LLFWKSVYDWADQCSIPSEYKEKIYLKYKSFDLSQKSGVTKYYNIFIEAIKNPNILKTQYRFNYQK